MSMKFRENFVESSNLGVWSEDIVLSAIKSQPRLHAVRYGASDSEVDRKNFKRNANLLRDAGNTHGLIKRPDILPMDGGYEDFARDFIRDCGGWKQLAYQQEDVLRPLLRAAKGAIEVEVSRSYARKLLEHPDKKQKPAIHIKEEDLLPLKCWQQTHGIPIQIWQLFVDHGWCIAFDAAVELIDKRAAKRLECYGKTVYQIVYTHCVDLGPVSGTVVRPATRVSPNGKIHSFPIFEGGELLLRSEAINGWQQ